MNRILGIIPARGGSKRIPGKNLRLLNGKPLVSYAIEAALQSVRLSEIVLSSDDDKILQLGASYGNRVICLKRPEALATDESPAIEYVKHTLQTMGKEFSLNYSMVVIIQATSPFTIAEDIDSTISSMEELATDCAVSVRQVPHDLHPLKFKKLVGGKLYPYIETENGRMAYHQLEKYYVRNGSVYVSSLKLIESGQLLNDHCAAYLMPDERSVDINTEMDYKFAQFLMQGT